MPYAIPLLKHKLRQLRKLELTIRSNVNVDKPGQKLVWDIFFSNKPDNYRVKYPLNRLVAMSEEEYRCVLDEFFFRVYFQSYKENSLVFGDVPDPHLLERFGLPPYADTQDVKNRFRTLAKLYHPDHGGDAEKFMELMAIYEKIADL